MQNAEAVSSRYRPGLFVLWSLVIVFVTYQVIGGGVSYLLHGAMVTVENAGWVRLSTFGGQVLFLLIPTLLLIRRQHGRLSSAIPYRKAHWGEYVLTFVGVFSLLQVLNGYIYFQDQIPLPPTIKPYIDNIRQVIEETFRLLTKAQSPSELFVVISIVAVTPAICEEILFRGLVQTNLQLASNPSKAYLLTGIIFGLYHFNPFLVVPLVILGIYFSFIRMRSASILMPMLAHCTNNLVTVIASYGSDASANADVLTASAGTNVSIVFSMIGFGILFAISLLAYLRITARYVQGTGAPVEEPKVDPLIHTFLGETNTEDEAAIIAANLKSVSIDAVIVHPARPDEEGEAMTIGVYQIYVRNETSAQALKLLEDLDLLDFFRAGS
jgi:hypothetical protein